jgi:hypothetical protein
MHKLTVDINDQVTVSLIEFLKHCLTADYVNHADSFVVASLCQTPSNRPNRAGARRGERFYKSLGNHTTRRSSQSIFVKPFIKLATAIMNSL